MALGATNVLDLESRSPAEEGGLHKTTFWIMDLEEWAEAGERERLFYEKLQAYGHYIFSFLMAPGGQAAIGEPQVLVLHLTDPTKRMLDVISLRERVTDTMVPVEFKSHAEFLKEHQQAV